VVARAIIHGKFCVGEFRGWSIPWCTCRV